MLHGYGAYTRTAPTVAPGKQMIPIQRSSADTYFLLNGGGAIETKTGHAGTFPMGTEPKTGPGLRQDQIDWGIEFQQKSGCIYWVFVVYETKDSPWRVPRDAFLIPLNAVLETMAKLPQKSLPYQVRKGMRLEIQNNFMDATSLWNEYRLYWKSGWVVPEEHLFHRLYIAPAPRVPTTIEMITQSEELFEHGRTAANVYPNP